MNDEYIKREDATLAIAYMRPMNRYDGSWVKKGDVIDALMAIPPADVVERKRGEWVLIGDKHPYLACEACKNPKPFGDSLFCDLCGADMRGDSNE